MRYKCSGYRLGKCGNRRIIETITNYRFETHAHVANEVFFGELGRDREERKVLVHFFQC